MPLGVKYNFTFFDDILEGFCDALGIDSTHLVVNDLGGPVGLRWAVRHPERIKRLVILNTLVYPQTSWAAKLFLIALRTPGVRDYLVSPKALSTVPSLKRRREQEAVPSGSLRLAIPVRLD